MKKVQYNRSRIRECRDIKGLTQKKVADLSKVSARTYQSAEAEEYINIKTANKINKTLGLNDEAYKSFKEPIEVTIKMNFKGMKELQSIQMRKDIKVLESYGFNCASMSKYIGDISDRAIREFVGDRARSLNNRNHERLRVWLEQIKTEINRLEEE